MNSSDCSPSSPGFDAAATSPPPPSPGVGLETPLTGVVVLGHLGVIRARGADAALFLQGQLTQDVMSLGSSQARLAAFCNAKGRMQATFVVFQAQPDDILLVCSRDVLAATLKRLSMFVLRAKVTLSDATPDLTLYGILGSAIDKIANSPMKTWEKTDVGSLSVITLPPSSGLVRALCCAPSGAPAPTGPALDVAVWQWLAVQSGMAMVSQPIAETLVPQMLNYESIGGVSFKKGCYPGQEVVARSQFRGTLKRRAYIVHCDAQPTVGQEIFHSADPEQPCGVVAASAPHPAGGFDAIVSMQTVAAHDAGKGQLTLGPAADAGSGAVLHLQPLPYPLLDDL